MVSTQGRAYSGSTLLCSEVYRARRELEGMVSTQGRVYSGSTLLCREVYRARRELEGMVLLPTESAALIEYILRLRAHAKVGGYSRVLTVQGSLTGTQQQGSYATVLNGYSV